MRRRVQDLGGLRHEPHAGERDDVGVRLLRAPGEVERVSDEVRQLLDFLFLVVVGEENGVFLSLEAPDFLFQVERRINRS